MSKQTSIVIKIDTSSNKEVQVEIEIDGKKEVLKHIVDRKTQAVLPMIERLLKENNLELKDISEVKVNQGPGSFTGLRVGIAIANALGYLLKIPVNGKKIGEIVEPIYN